jgi:MFS family permease
MQPSSAVGSTAAATPWYRSLNRQQWNTLLAANLGWLFDGYETYSLILTMGVAYRQLLPPESYPAIPFYAGVTIAATLLGWGVGGIIGGILSDYFGRKRTLVYAVLAYSVVTGLTALAWSWSSFLVLRLIVGLALGSEWGTGTSMMAEMWPDKHRGKGAGLMQCGLGIGFFIASAIWFFVSSLGPSAWRWMYVIGVLPAIAVGWIRRRIEEPTKWAEADRRRREAAAARKLGRGSEEAKERFTLVDVFSDPRTRRLTLIAVIMATTTTLAWWGISTWIPPYVASVAAQQGRNPERWASLAGMAYNLGGVIGYISLGFVADAYGRRVATVSWYAFSLLMTPVLFVWTHDLFLLLLVCAINAFFTIGQFTWCSTWLPEVYPTRIRGTAVSFVFNAPRFIAFLGPLLAGTLITYFGNYGRAAVIVGLIYIVGIVTAPFFPETRGKPLPE